MATPVAQTFECHICTWEANKNRVVTANGSCTCHACLENLINRVANGSDTYPLKINNSTVDLEPWSTTLDPRLLEKYRSLKQEHSIAPAQRVYCASEHFVGTKVAPSSHQGADFIAVSKCHSCEGATCMICATHLDKDASLSQIFQHGCKEKLAATERVQDAIINGSERGKTYQLCPTCKREIHREDACNHMKCACGTEFCYVCGEPAKGNIDHWSRGVCPKWPNRPAANNRAAALPNINDNPFAGLAERHEDIARRIHGPEFDAMHARIANNRAAMLADRRRPRDGVEGEMMLLARAGEREARQNAAEIARAERELDVGMRARLRPEQFFGVQPARNAEEEETRIAHEVRRRVDRRNEQLRPQRGHERFRREREDDFFGEG